MLWISIEGKLKKYTFETRRLLRRDKQNENFVTEKWKQKKVRTKRKCNKKNLNSSTGNPSNPRNNSSDDERKFLPIDIEWQKEICNKLNLPFKGESHPRNSSYGAPLRKPALTVPIVGDENCLFRSISYAICGNENHHPYVRELVVDYMITNRNRYETQVNGEFDRYIANMSQEGEWGSDQEMMAFAEILRVPIRSYTKVGTKHMWIDFVPRWLGVDDNDPGIYLEHKNQNHFDVVVMVQTL